MDAVLDRVEQLESNAKAQAWKKYAALLKQGSDADAAALADTMRILALSPQMVQAHARQYAEAQHAEKLAGTLDERRRQRDEANGHFAQALETIARKKEELREFELEARRQAAAAGTAYDAAHQAVSRLESIRRDLSFLFIDAPAPELPQAAFLDHALPTSIDGRLLTLNPAAVFTIHELVNDFGADAAAMKRAGIPALPGGVDYSGVVVRQWARGVQRILLARRRQAIETDLVPIDPKWAHLESQRYYTAEEQRAWGLPMERFRTRKEQLSTTNDGRARGSDIADWARRRAEKNTQLAAQLEEVAKLENELAALEQADAQPAAELVEETPAPVAEKSAKRRK